MLIIKAKIGILFLLFILLALISSIESIFSQIPGRIDTINKIPPLKSVNFRKNFNLFTGDTSLNLAGGIITSEIFTEEAVSDIYNTLKTRTENSVIAHKLLDFIIVTQNPVESRRITGKSENFYNTGKGKIIRNINIQRLDVFGVNIDDPFSSNPDRLENILNRLHINTHEKIIRNNLLFSEGDTLSPLALSDNERILRQLPYIDDARILVIPVTDYEADIIVITKDVFPLGAEFSFKGLKKGSVAVFDRNIIGIGHSLGVEMPYDAKLPDSPGFGVNYIANNIRRSFVDLKLNYNQGLGVTSYGFSMKRDLFSSTTRYAGGIDLKRTFTTEDLDSLPVPEPLRYNLQDYWLSRSFFMDKEPASRLTLGLRYTVNNVFSKPSISAFSYHSLQKYRMFMGEAAFSVQRYYKTNLIYGYGRVEDIPYGGLVKVTAGHEINEFKKRTYMGGEVSFGGSIRTLGYFYTSAGFSTFLNKGATEQGIISLKMRYFSNLVYIGSHRIRNFINIDYTRGIDRYNDEYLRYIPDNGLSGFKNDSITGNRRFNLGLESVLFSSLRTYGFRFAFFWFADLAFLNGINELIPDGNILSGAGIGVRIRNNNLVFKTLQIRLGFFPNLPPYSKVSNVTVSGEQLLKPYNFDPGKPSVIQYR
jgi:hypothetical protein